MKTTLLLLAIDLAQYVCQRHTKSGKHIRQASTEPVIKNEFIGDYNGLLERKWKYAKMSGIR